MTCVTGPWCDFSLVICTYNRAEQLGEALRTALRQETDGRFSYEVVVIDNNSTDATRAVVESFLAEGHENLRYLFEGRQGKSHALNTALETVSGAYYTIVDDDFLLPARWLCGIHDGLSRYPAAAFVGGKVLPLWSATPPAWLTPEHWSAIAMADYGEQEFSTSLDHQVCLLACTFSTHDAKAVGGYDTRLGVKGSRIGGVEDLDLLVRLWKAGKVGVYLPESSFLHKVEADRLTKRYHRRWHRDHGRSYAIMRDPETERASARLLDVPRYMYRELLGSAFAIIVHSLAMRKSAVFSAETRWWFLVGFCRERWRQYLGNLTT